MSERMTRMKNEMISLHKIGTPNSFPEVTNYYFHYYFNLLTLNFHRFISSYIGDSLIIMFSILEVMLV